MPRRQQSASWFTVDVAALKLVAVHFVVIICALDSPVVLSESRVRPRNAADEQNSWTGTSDYLPTSAHAAVPSAEYIMEELRSALSATSDDVQPSERRHNRQVGNEREESERQGVGLGNYRVKTFREALSPSGQAGGGDGLFFNVSQHLTSQIRVHYAVLSVLVHCDTPASLANRENDDGLTHASIRPILPSPGADAANSMTTPTPFLCRSSESTWVRSIVTPLIQYWLRGNSEKPMCLLSSGLGSPGLCLVLNTTARHSSSLDVIYEMKGKETCDSTSPLLAPGAATSAACCRVPYFVDFRHTAMQEQILFPSGYEAYACHGSCPMTSPNMMGQLSERNDTADEVKHWLTSARRQCQPIAYAPVFVMLRDKLSYPSIEPVKDSIVLACGCAG